LATLLSAEGLTVYYGRQQALADVSFTVGAGEVVAILGPNGAGKTTTAKSVAGIVRPTAGRITFEGKDVTDRAADRIVKDGVVLVPEGRRIFTSLSVRENLLVGGYTRKAALQPEVERVVKYFQILGDKMAQRGGQLSGGQQQMLAIGRALMSGPRLLILDEPTMGLAPIVVDQLADILLGLNRDGGLAVLLIDQRLSLVEKIATRAYVMRAGRIRTQFKMGELAKHELEALYMAGTDVAGSGETEGLSASG
jgi:branched-chain amino acid transport system ATP-binding protein